MRILVVHNYYRSSAPSGEDAVVRDEVALLRRSGFDVVTFERHNDAIGGSALDLLRAGFSTIWSGSSRKELAAVMRLKRPDVAHFHNLWYLISPSAYAACRELGVPIVQTVHNFRTFCANGLLLRDGRVCDDCVGNWPWRGVLHGCYESRLRSVPVVAAQAVHRARGAWFEPDLYIALSAFARSVFIAAGLPGERIVVKPNTFGGDLPDPVSDEGYAVFLGRLSREKGAETLVRAAERFDFPVKVIGDGPLRAALAASAQSRQLRHLEFLGRMDHSASMRILSAASFLVSPSLCYESFPRAIVEAFALGKPVVASRLGAPAELVAHGETGLLCAPGDPSELAEAVRTLAAGTELRRAMGLRARSTFRLSYDPEQNARALVGFYAEAIARKRAADAPPAKAVDH